MTSKELLSIINNGETSKVQFKRQINSVDSIAAEMIAFSNSKGGVILIGVEDKTGQVIGLSNEQLPEYNQLIAKIANNNIKSSIFLFTEIVELVIGSEVKKILIAEISEGVNKPYKENNGTIWIKQGSDKRKLTENSELVRLFQQSGTIYVDELTLPQTSVNDIDFSQVEKYIKVIQKKIEDDKIEITPKLLTNVNILRDNHLTLAGLLCFSKNPQKYRPAFCIKAISFFGNSIGGSDYRSSKDIEGTIPEMFEKTIDFFNSNLHHIQADQNFN